MTSTDPFEEKPRNPRLDPQFPITVERLREIYSVASFPLEYQRRSFEDVFNAPLSQGTLSQFVPNLTDPTASPPQPLPELLQRHFYWSVTCFYRSFYLMLAYLALERKPFYSWAHVTAYYSRFYIIKAILNFFLINNVELNKKRMHDRDDSEFVVYTAMDGVKAMQTKPLKQQWKAYGSHQIWWALFQQIGYVSDFPQTDGAAFILSDAYFNSGSRNALNYSERYLEGFIELEWFDSSTNQMLNHLETWKPRRDRDITDIDAFFEGFDPETCDEGDFYGDEGQIVWLSIRVYLELLKATGVQQQFVTKEKLFALLERFAQDEYPRLCAAIRTSIADTLP